MLVDDDAQARALVRARRASVGYAAARVGFDVGAEAKGRRASDSRS